MMIEEYLPYYNRFDDSKKANWLQLVLETKRNFGDC